MFDDAHRVERLDYVFSASMRQLPIADQDAKTTGREICARNSRDAIDGNSKSNTVIGAVPLISFQQETYRRGPIDVGELVRFLAAVVNAEPREHTEVRTDFLLKIQSQSRARGEMAYKRGVGSRARCVAEAHGVAVASHPAMVEKTEYLQLSRVSTELVTSLEFSNEGEFLEPRFERLAVRNIGQIEESSPDSPPGPRPFDYAADGVSPGIGRVVESGRVDDRPVQKIATGVVGIGVGVEDIDDRQFADSHRHIVGCLRSAELVGAGKDRVAVSCEIEPLAEECPLQTEIRFGLPDLVSFAARKSRRAQGVAQAEPLVDLGIDVERAAIPEAKPGEERQV